VLYPIEFVEAIGVIGGAAAPARRAVSILAKSRVLFVGKSG
jgi:hypothetical protein